MKHLKYELTLISVALVIYCIVGFLVGSGYGAELGLFDFGFPKAGATAGAKIAVVTVAAVLVTAVITAVLGTVACFIVAALLGTNFGNVKSACTKLAAIALFPGAAGAGFALISPLLGFSAIVVGAVAVIILTFGLLKTLFELTLFELVVFVFVLFWVEVIAVKLKDYFLGGIA